MFDFPVSGICEMVNPYAKTFYLKRMTDWGDFVVTPPQNYPRYRDYALEYPKECFE